MVKPVEKSTKELIDIILSYKRIYPIREIEVLSARKNDAVNEIESALKEHLPNQDKDLGRLYLILALLDIPDYSIETLLMIIKSFETTYIEKIAAIEGILKYKENNKVLNELSKSEIVQQKILGILGLTLLNTPSARLRALDMLNNSPLEASMGALFLTHFKEENDINAVYKVYEKILPPFRHTLYQILSAMLGRSDLLANFAQEWKFRYSPSPLIGRIAFSIPETLFLLNESYIKNTLPADLSFPPVFPLKEIKPVKEENNLICEHCNKPKVKIIDTYHCPELAPIIPVIIDAGVTAIEIFGITDPADAFELIYPIMAKYIAIKNKTKELTEKLFIFEILFNTLADSFKSDITHVYELKMELRPYSSTAANLKNLSTSLLKNFQNEIATFYENLKKQKSK